MARGEVCDNEGKRGHDDANVDLNGTQASSSEAGRSQVISVPGRSASECCGVSTRRWSPQGDIHLGTHSPRSSWQLAVIDKPVMENGKSE